MSAVHIVCHHDRQRQIKSKRHWGSWRRFSYLEAASGLRAPPQLRDRRRCSCRHLQCLRLRAEHPNTFGKSHQQRVFWETWSQLLNLSVSSFHWNYFLWMKYCPWKLDSVFCRFIHMTSYKNRPKWAYNFYVICWKKQNSKLSWYLSPAKADGRHRKNYIKAFTLTS